MKIRPLGNRVLVEVIADVEEKRGAIFLPDASKKQSNNGKVVGVGKLCTEVKLGDTVLLPVYGMAIDGKTPLRMFKEDELLAVIE